jgi:ParB-like chromosome segregation protein Spo0J
MERHKYAELFPEMSPEDYARVRESIREAGRLYEPITIFEGKILDGRHRWSEPAMSSESRR